MKTALFALTIPCTFLFGCSYFIPVHPGTWLVGSVSDPNGVSIASADVTLYAKKVSTDKNGCFNVESADQIPFTFVVSGLGYKPIEMKSLVGFYRGTAKLDSETSAGNSQAEWTKITEAEYRSAKPCGS